MTNPAYRADKARQLLDDPVLVEAFESIERDLINELKRSRIWFGRRKREALIQQLQLLEDVKQTLRVYITLGKQAAQRGGR